MIDITPYNKSHKHFDADWRSEKYRKFLVRNANCMACGNPLLNEKEGYEPHHYEHNRSTDAVYLPLCLSCHNRLHYSAKSKEDWMIQWRITEMSFEKHIILAATSYALKLGHFDTMINLLSDVLPQMEVTP